MLVSGGDPTGFTDGLEKTAEHRGARMPEFLVFIEIYNLNGELILNYPVERCAEAGLEDAMKRQVTRYGKLLENVCICSAAIEISLVETAEWFVFEHFQVPEFLIAETLDRAEKNARPENEQKSCLDFIEEAERLEAGTNGTAAISGPKMPTPALCEYPAKYEIIALPIRMRAKSVKIEPFSNRIEEASVREEKVSENRQ